MKEGCAIGDENQGHNKVYIPCMNGKFLHIWVKDLGTGHKRPQVLALADGAVGPLPKHWVLFRGGAGDWFSIVAPLL